LSTVVASTRVGLVLLGASCARSLLGAVWPSYWAHRLIEIFGFSTIRRKLAKLRLGSLPAAITGDKKLYSKDEYDSNAENEVRK
jgi:hypothetical protein